MIPLRDYPGDTTQSFPWIMLGILILNVAGLRVRARRWAARSTSTVLFSSAGVVPVEFTRGVDVGAAAAARASPGPRCSPACSCTAASCTSARTCCTCSIFGDNVEDRLGHLRFLDLLPAVRARRGLTHILFNVGLVRPQRRRLGRDRGRPGRVPAPVPARPGAHAAVPRAVHHYAADPGGIPDRLLVRDPVSVGCALARCDQRADLGRGGLGACRRLRSRPDPGSVACAPSRRARSQRRSDTQLAKATLSC